MNIFIVKINQENKKKRHVGFRIKIVNWLNNQWISWFIFIFFITKIWSYLGFCYGCCETLCWIDQDSRHKRIIVDMTILGKPYMFLGLYWTIIYCSTLLIIRLYWTKPYCTLLIIRLYWTKPLCTLLSIKLYWTKPYCTLFIIRLY